MALIGWARSVLAVVVDGAKILWGYWPTLLVIFLVGQALRNALLWLAVVVSSYTSVGAALLVPLAPLATLSALILMLRAVAPALSLSVGPPPEETGPGRIRARLDLLASTLVPFLAVYAAQGYLIEDRWVFVQEAVADEFTNGSDFWLGGSFDTGRTTVADGWAYWALVAVAFGLRWLVDRLDLPRKARGWGLVAAYLEATWVLLFATALARRISGIWDWVEQRAFVATIYGWWEQATSWLGPLTDPVRSFMSYIWGAIGGADAVVMVPLAWLTLGAVVYGRDSGATSALARPSPANAAARPAARQRHSGRHDRAILGTVVRPEDASARGARAHAALLSDLRTGPVCGNRRRSPGQVARRSAGRGRGHALYAVAVGVHPGGLHDGVGLFACGRHRPVDQPAGIRSTRACGQSQLIRIRSGRVSERVTT